MLRRRFAALPSLLTLSLMGIPAVSSAQSNPADAVNALAVGQVVRLQAPGTVITLGSVSEIDAETLYVLEGDQEWFVDIASIQRLEVRTRAIGRHVLMFGALGALMGYAGNAFRESTPVSPFVIGGVTVGAVVGFSRPVWRVQFPR